MPKKTQDASETPAFRLQLHEPFSTFVDGKPQVVPYVISGLCTQGGMSILGGKSKYGKSSFTRYEAVCVAKGTPCIGRITEPGDVVLVSLEDPRSHVDNCLKALGYGDSNDGKLHIADRAATTLEANVDALRDVLVKMPDVRFVVIDTLAKFIRVDDLNDYMPVLKAVEALRNLAREFPKVHIQAAVHCKKVRTEDPFDGLLGSTALRAEADTNIALFGELNQRLIAAETRIGKHIPPTILKGELDVFADAEVVKNFSLDIPFDEWQSNQSQKTSRRDEISHEDRIIEFLRVNGGSAKQADVLNAVQGKRVSKTDAIKTLFSDGVLSTTGRKQSPTDPTVLHLNEERIKYRQCIDRFEGRIQ